MYNGVQERILTPWSPGYLSIGLNVECLESIILIDMLSFSREILLKGMFQDVIDHAWCK